LLFHHVLRRGADHRGDGGGLHGWELVGHLLGRLEPLHHHLIRMHLLLLWLLLLRNHSLKLWRSIMNLLLRRWGSSLLHLIEKVRIYLFRQESGSKSSFFLTFILLSSKSFLSLCLCQWLLNYLLNRYLRLLRWYHWLILRFCRYKFLPCCFKHWLFLCGGNGNFLIFL